MVVFRALLVLPLVNGQNSSDSGEACNTFMDCGSCADAEHLFGTSCRWCPKTGQCHAYGSIYNTCSSEQQITDPMYCPKTPPQGYSEARALEYAKLAGAAYCSQESLETWSCGYKCSADLSSVTVCNGQNTKAYVGLWEGQCLVSFQGTSNIGSAWEDIQFWKKGIDWAECDGCHVHSGFLDEYTAVRQCVQTALRGTGCAEGSQIRTTGHSLGASMNSLAMVDLTDAGWIIEESYDFGKPRTGDSNFAANHNRLFQNKPIWRVTHGWDPVPQMPPTDLLDFEWHFEHVKQEIYYPGDVMGGYALCNVDDHTCGVEVHWDAPLNLLNIDDHLNYMGIETSIFGCGKSLKEEQVGESTVVA